MVPVLAEDFTFGHFLLGVLYLFGWIILFWLIITVFADLFRRHDASGWVKALWVIFVIVLPFIGVLAYLITQHAGMADRSMRQQQQARDELRQSLGVGVADEIDKLERLRSEGKVSPDEYERLRARLVQ
jgi:heme A synthase